MNIFNKVALQGLKKSRTRTIVTVIGVILSAAMITAVATFGVSLLDYMEKGATEKYGDWHAACLNADASFAKETSESPDVADTFAFQNIGYAHLKDGKNPQRPYLFIAGFSQNTFDALPLTLLSGRLPENSSEILVSGGVSKNSDFQLAVGDSLSLAVGNRTDGQNILSQANPYEAGHESLEATDTKTYTVVGICQTPAFERDTAPGYTLITSLEASNASHASEASKELSLFVKLKNPRQVESYTETSSEGHDFIRNNDVLRFMGLSDDPGDGLFTTLLLSSGFIVIVIIMIGSVFLIYNSFNISLNERTQQFGILSSVGATAKQLRNSVLFEGLCIGAMGIPVGIAVGIASIWLVISVVARNFSSILYAGVPLTMTISLPAILTAAVVSMVTILISAYIPARKAASTPVMECIRQTNEVKVESRAVKTSSLSQRIYGLEGTLALKNFKRNKKRYRSIVLSLVLSVVLFISTSAFVTELKQTSDQAKAVTTYDIGFGTQDMDNSSMLQLYDMMKTARGVKESSCQSIIDYSFIVDSDKLSQAYRECSAKSGDTFEEPAPSDSTVSLPVDVQFIDDAAYNGILKELGLSADKYSGGSNQVLAVAKINNDSPDVKGVKQLSDMFNESSISCNLVPKVEGRQETDYGQNVNVKCVEMMPPDIPPTAAAIKQLPYTLNIMAPYSLMAKLLPDDIQPDVLVKGMVFSSDNPAASTAEMKTMIESYGVAASYVFINTSKALDDNRNYIFIANVFAYTFIIMISLIAVANVFNTISTNIKLRRRELAMLRSVGMSDRDFNKMMRFECALYGIKALLIGLPLSVISSLMIHTGMFAGDTDYTGFTLPWSSMGISILGVLLIIFITMMYAVSKIKKENIIDALRDDMA